MIVRRRDDTTVDCTAGQRLLDLLSLGSRGLEIVALSDDTAVAAVVRSMPTRPATAFTSSRSRTRSTASRCAVVSSRCC